MQYDKFKTNLPAKSKREKGKELGKVCSKIHAKLLEHNADADAIRRNTDHIWVSNGFGFFFTSLAMGLSSACNMSLYGDRQDSPFGRFKIDQTHQVNILFTCMMLSSPKLWCKPRTVCTWMLYILLVMYSCFTMYQLFMYSSDVDTKQALTLAVEYEPKEELDSKASNKIKKQAEKIVSDWEHIFLCSVNNYNYNSVDLNYTYYGVAGYRVYNCSRKNNNTSGFDRNTCDTALSNSNVRKLMTKTIEFFNLHILKFSYHYMISLRRQILIVLFINNIDINQINIDSLLKVFVTHYKQHKVDAILNKYQWFHLHVSKSAGRAMEQTFRQIFGHNRMCKHSLKDNIKCEYQYQFANNTSCAYIGREQPAYTYSDENLMVNNKNKISASFFKDKASTCEKFIYILPMREPIERIFSHCGQINQRPAFFAMDNILRRKDSLIKNRLENENVDKKLDKKNITMKNLNMIESSSKWFQDNICYNKDIIINGVAYRLMMDGIDYRGYFKSLYDTEMDYFNSINCNINPNEYENGEIVDKKTFNSRVNDTSTIDHFDLYQFDVPLCFINRYDVELFPIDYQYINHLNESQFIYVVQKGYRLFRTNIEKLRTITGSNIYTSWFGYQSKYYKKYSWLPNYVSRSKITQKHLFNAINFFLKMDYILPFSTKKHLNENTNDKLIWNIALKDVYHHYLNTTDIISFEKIWQIENDFIHYQSYKNKLINKLKNDAINIKWAERLISKSDPYRRVMPSDISQSISNDEKELLYKWNNFDLKLYQIAKLIEMVDLKFYNFVQNSSTNYY